MILFLLKNNHNLKGFLKVLCLNETDLTLEKKKMGENVILLVVCVTTALSTGHVVEVHRLVGLIGKCRCYCSLDYFKNRNAIQ